MDGILRDKTRVVMDKKHHYGITDSDNVVVDKKYQTKFGFNAEYLYNALSAMKNMNEGKLDFSVYLPNEPFPIVLDNGIQCYLIAPIVPKDEDLKF